MKECEPNEVKGDKQKIVTLICLEIFNLYFILKIPYMKTVKPNVRLEIVHVPNSHLNLQVCEIQIYKFTTFSLTIILFIGTR